MEGTQAAPHAISTLSHPTHAQQELFLVPDHRVRAIPGASFAGFYYICLNKRTGCIEGLYFHRNSELYEMAVRARPWCMLTRATGNTSFQSLTLTHEPSRARGDFSFR